MRKLLSNTIAILLAVAGLLLAPGSENGRKAAAQAQAPIVLKVTTALDGAGKIIRNTIIVVEGSKIARIGGAAPAGAITYDLTGLTVSPGWIDTHAHIMN